MADAPLRPRGGYYGQMQRVLDGLGDSRPSLLLHVCCAPCSTAVIEALGERFALTLYYYNPNIYPAAEYEKRLGEFARADTSAALPRIAAEYDPDFFRRAVSGLEDEPEGGRRCRVCYALRLERAARAAAEGGFDFFTTTLSVSPHKNADWINELGTAAGEKYGAVFLPSDFKKRDGYKRSVELSERYGLYRQDYCGCEFSLSERRGG